MKNLYSAILCILIFGLSSCNRSQSVVVYCTLVQADIYQGNKYTPSKSGLVSDNGLMGYPVNIGETVQIQMYYGTKDQDKRRTLTCIGLPEGYSIILKNRYGNTIARFNSVADKFDFLAKDLK